MRFVIGMLLATLALSGCARLAGRPLFCPPAKTQNLFLQVLEGDDRDRQTEAYRQLEEQYPDCPWTHRAVTLEAERKALRKSRANLSWQKKELNRCRQASQRLESENRKLLENRNELKKLIIEMETIAR